MTVCGEAAGAVAAMRGIAVSSPHAAIVDLSFEDGSGLNLIEQIRFHCPRTIVLVLSMYDEACYAHRVLRAGARGYISKREPTKRILAALRCVLQGKIYLSPEYAQRLMRDSIGASTSHKAWSMETLSDREIDVFTMIGRGLGTRRIADLLHLSPKTIQAYHGRIKEKLHLRDATELLREAIHWTEGAGKRSRGTTRPADYDALTDVGHATEFR